MPDDVSFIVTSVTKTLELTIVEYVPISLFKDYTCTFIT